MAENLSKLKNFLHTKDPESHQQISRRQIYADRARIPTPATKLSYGPTEPTTDTSNGQSYGSQQVLPKKSQDVQQVKQEFSQTHGYKPSGFETDLDELDDSTISSHDLQMKNSQLEPQTQPYKKLHYAHNDGSLRQVSEGLEKSEHEVGSEEEESGEDSSTEGASEEDDPATYSMNYNGRNTFGVLPEEAAEYADFLKRQSLQNGKPRSVLEALSVRKASNGRYSSDDPTYQSPSKHSLSQQHRPSRDRPAQSYQDPARDQAVVPIQHDKAQVLGRNASYEAGELDEEHPRDDSIGKARPIPGARHRQQDLQEISRKRPFKLDYSDTELSSMTYDHLKNESFDNDPCAPLGILPDDIATASLPDQLKYISGLNHHSEQDEQQKAFFSSLDIDRYEECGDLIVERFTTILTKFKNARQEKRKIAMGFEEEVAKREEQVSAKRALIDQDMDRLKSAGREIVKGGDKR
ncbi:hypothetical protein MMC24_001600 [Lignoscripta atroalba]|nr:hypothetical protein [Lignoscripta atroalba]